MRVEMVQPVEYIQVKCRGGGKYIVSRYDRATDTFVTHCSWCTQVVETTNGKAKSHLTRRPK